MPQLHSTRGRGRAGFTVVETVCTAVIVLVAVALLVPLFLSMARRAQLRVNMVNVRTVHTTALTSIQTQLGDMDSTTPDSRPVNRGLAEGAGWVAMAQVDEYNEISETRLYVVDEIEDYKSGIALGKVDAPVSVSSGAEFYVQPAEEKIWSPFAGIRPTSGGNHVYTVQVALDNLDMDLSKMRR